jgi:hypothetical protein
VKHPVNPTPQKMSEPWMFDETELSVASVLQSVVNFMAKGGSVIDNTETKFILHISIGINYNLQLDQ